MSTYGEWYLIKYRSLYAWKTYDEDLYSYIKKIKTDIVYRRLAIANNFNDRLDVNNIQEYFTEDILNRILLIFEKLYYKILLDDQVNTIYKMFDIYKKLFCNIKDHNFLKQKELLDTFQINNTIFKEPHFVNFIHKFTDICSCYINNPYSTKEDAIAYRDSKFQLLKIINRIKYKYIEFYIRNCNLIKSDIDKDIENKIKDMNKNRYDKDIIDKLYGYGTKRRLHNVNRQIKKRSECFINNDINYYIGKTLNIPKFGNAVLTSKVKNYNNRYIIQYPSGSKYILKVDEIIKIINEIRIKNQIQMNYNDTIMTLKYSIYNASKHTSGSVYEEDSKFCGSNSIVDDKKTNYIVRGLILNTLDRIYPQ